MWAPSRNPEITQTVLLVYEVEVVVQALARIIFKRCLAGSFVMPGFVARACLHSREDMHQTRMRAAFFKDFFDALLLAKGFDLVF